MLRFSQSIHLVAKCMLRHTTIAEHHSPLEAAWDERTMNAFFMISAVSSMQNNPRGWKVFNAKSKA